MSFTAHRGTERTSSVFPLLSLELAKAAFLHHSEEVANSNLLRDSFWLLLIFQSEEFCITSMAYQALDFNKGL
jgi:hypothetical protein